MSNNRANIRTALQTLLEDVDATVFTSRTSNIPTKDLPAIIIYTPSEPATPRALGSRQYIRDLEITLEVKVQASSDVDNELDALVSDIEAAIDGDPSVGGTLQSLVQTNTETRVDEQGEQPIGVAVLTFQAKYIS
jgi:hypothetical protein